MTKTIWTNKKFERVLRENNWDVPEFPNTGKVFFNEKEVGHIDNFSGMTIKDNNAINFIEENNGKIFNVGIWNNWSSKDNI